MKCKILLIILGLMLILPHASMAVKVAPRISDREIVERLTRLEEGQKSLNKRIDDLHAEMNQRFQALESQIDQRFHAMQAQMDQRFQALHAQMDQRFHALHAQMDQRFTALEAQNDRIWTLMLVIIAGIMGLIGYIIWDRKTALHPLERRLSEMEVQLNGELELDNELGTVSHRVAEALRRYSHDKASLKEILRSLSLL